MAVALTSLSPLWRNGLRIWLATSLTIGILLWSGRGHQLPLALVMAVLFVNENDLTPARSIAQMIAGALLGILISFVLHQISSGWLMLGVAMLITASVVRGLGLLKGLSTGYLACWAVDLMEKGNRFDWSLVFDLTYAVLVGILMAQIATWALWPRPPLQQLKSMEAGIAQQLSAQITAMQQWLSTGGEPPPVLRSQQLLPAIQQLEQWHRPERRAGQARRPERLEARVSQAGALWRQLLRSWLLLEPLLRQLQAPLPASAEAPLLQHSLAELAGSLQPSATAAALGRSSPSPERWLAQASSLGISKPLMLAIGAQCAQLQGLLYSRSLLKGTIRRLAETAR